MALLKYRLGYRALRRVAPHLSRKKARALARDLGYAMKLHNIDTVRRATMFVAQLAHESAEFKFTEELASGAAYEGRCSDLGNCHPGDGRRYKGRSYIQITGRRNYRELPKWDGIDFELSPEKLARQRYAALAAAWWWREHGCNRLADQGDRDQAFLDVTRRINGGFNGLSDRKMFFERAWRESNRHMLVPARRVRPVL